MFGTRGHRKTTTVNTRAGRGELSHSAVAEEKRARSPFVSCLYLLSEPCMVRKMLSLLDLGEILTLQ